MVRCGGGGREQEPSECRCCDAVGVGTPHTDEQADEAGSIASGGPHATGEEDAMSPTLEYPRSKGTVLPTKVCSVGRRATEG